VALYIRTALNFNMNKGNTITTIEFIIPYYDINIFRYLVDIVSKLVKKQNCVFIERDDKTRQLSNWIEEAKDDQNLVLEIP